MNPPRALRAFRHRSFRIFFLGQGISQFGTWLQLYQASTAPDLRLRSVARRIALDEARHAALSFRIFDWLDQKLDHAGRQLVAARLFEARGIGGQLRQPSHRRLTWPTLSTSSASS